MKFVRKHINESGFFKNPAQAKAAIDKGKDKSKAELVAKQSNNIICSKLKEICDHSVIQVAEDRVRNVHIGDNSEILLDVDYVQAHREGHDGAETTFLGHNFSWANMGKDSSSGKRNVKIELSYDDLAKTSFIKNYCNHVKKNNLDKVKIDAIKKLSTITPTDPDYGYYEMLDFNKIDISKYYIFSRYHTVTIFPTRYRNKNYDICFIGEEDFYERSLYSDEDIEQIRKNLFTYFVPDNAGNIVLRTLTEFHKDFLNEKRINDFKMLVREALDFSYTQYFHFMCRFTKQKEKELYDTGGYAYYRDEYMDELRKEHESLSEFCERYYHYMQKQKDNMYSSKFKILKVGLVYNSNYSWLIDPKSGKMEKYNESEIKYGEKYLLYPSAIMYITFTLDGEFEESVCFGQERESLDFYFINSREKAMKYLRFWNHKSEVGRYVEELIEEEGEGRRAINSGYYEALRDFKKTAGYLVIEEIIKRKLFLM